MSFNRMPVRLPVSIEPCPIIDATLELRFKTTVPGPAMPGLVYEKLKTQFPKISQVQTVPFNEAAAKLNPALRYQSHARLDSENFAVLVGPNVFAVGVVGLYTKWAQVSKGFSNAIAAFVDSIPEITPERFGLRYTNFFSGNILSKLNLGIAVADRGITGADTYLRATIDAHPFKIQVQIVTDAQVTPGDPRLPVDPDVPSTLVILDCYKDQLALEPDFLSKIQENLEEAHTKEKILFFEILKDELVERLNPRYEDAI
jgi:uncharacterized protein (TIGR04255 family)